MKLPNETELINIAKMAGLTAIEYFNGMLTNSISVKIDSIDKFIEIAKTKGNTIFYQIDQIDDNNESISKLEIDDLLEKANQIGGKVMAINLVYLDSGYAVHASFEDKEVRNIYEEIMIILDEYNNQLRQKARDVLASKLESDETFRFLDNSESRIIYVKDKYASDCATAFDSTAYDYTRSLNRFLTTIFERVIKK